MVFSLGVSVQGDVVVSVYHMRSTIGGRLQAKVIFKRCTLFLCEPAPFIGPINKLHLCSGKEKKTSILMKFDKDDKDHSQDANH